MEAATSFHKEALALNLLCGCKILAFHEQGRSEVSAVKLNMLKDIGGV